jgi:hypothetical protein
VLGKFDAKTDFGIFLGYSSRSKAYRVFNKYNLRVEESMNITFDESKVSLDKKLENDTNEEVELSNEPSPKEPEETDFEESKEEEQSTNEVNDQGTKNN